MTFDLYRNTYENHTEEIQIIILEVITIRFTAHAHQKQD